MTSYTPLYGLPYPDASDPIRDGAATMRSLAEALEKAMRELPATGPVPPPVTATLTRTTNQTIPSAVDTDLQLTTTLYSLAPSGKTWSGTTGALTVPVKGIYRVTGNAVYNEPTPFNTAGVLSRTRISTRTNLAATTGPGSNNAGPINITTEVALNAGDVLRFAVYQGSGTNKTIGNTWFGGESWPRLSATLIAYQ
ncbi:hypothetical protein C3V38_07965 [Dietzia sp. oral taxon 368]|uniref:hypothetical protein n=1 Tax=Dietzia sp. oral taxon 368 TaxID=712270 RepID=UPI000D086D52|nr:hypothetical protein [Dietzia sp. oral taxon 368]AVM64338.1 hypothetical protein C3V38_07965 [Dietzia sp. oral taxon 368]